MSVYRLAPGHITHAALIAGSSYVVENFAVYGGYQWRVGSDGVVSTYLERTRTPTPRDYALGKPSTSWTFAGRNIAQIDWLVDTYMTDLLVAPVTLMTFRFNSQSASGIARGWVGLQAYMSLQSGQTSEDTTGVNNTWNRDYTVNFIRGTYLTP